jgi:hypothetical protein
MAALAFVAFDVVGFERLVPTLRAVCRSDNSGSQALEVALG